MEDRLKEDTKSIQAKAEANMKIHRQEIVAKIDANQEMEAIVHSLRSERHGKIQRRIENGMGHQEILRDEAAVRSMGAWREETMARQETTEPT
jgi:Mg2+/Co2+ transporter CorB